jgi:hypothetical protein
VFAWTVLGLVFADEILAAAAAGVWGAHSAGVWLAVLAPIVVIVCWWAFASPRAPYGGRVLRPVVKAIVFGLASWGLWAAGQHAAGVALLVFSVLVNALAQLPNVRRATSTSATV